MSPPKDKHVGMSTQFVLGYLALIACAIGAYLWIRESGAHVSAPAPAMGATLFGPHTGAATVDALLHVLLALLVITALARTLGRLCKLIGQPPVIGEIVAGILLGPSLLGRVAPAAAAFVLPKTVAPFLGILSQVGVILFMFLVGVELDPSLLRKRGHATLLISHASIVVPFVLGAGLAVGIYPLVSTSDVPFTAFSLFMGVSMSVTAFPVLARILTDRKMQRSEMGVLALTCAAIDDVSAWCLLAFVVSVVQARATGGLTTGLLAVGYIAVTVFGLRPLMVRLSRHVGNKGQLTQGAMAIVFLSILFSAAATDAIGIHAVFGAFAIGAAIPHDSLLARELINRLEDLVVVLFLPAFFAFTGLRTEIGLLNQAHHWLLCGGIILVASLGKFGGSTVAARLTGVGWRDAAALGVLMNTRGLMELIVLNIGLELRILSPTLFAMLVLMALVTTFTTTPILHLITRGKVEPESLPAPRPPRRREGVLVPISNPAGMRMLIDLAAAATGPDDPRPRLLALVRRPSGGVRTRIAEEADPPLAQVLHSALDYARTSSIAVDAQSRWTDDPANDILDVSRDPEIRWVLLGFHRPVFGADAMGGVIKRVFDRAPEFDVDVGVLIHSHARPIERVVVVVDDSADGRAALDLACRVARANGRVLRLVLIPKVGAEPEAALQELVRRAGRESARWLSSDILSRGNSSQLSLKTQGDLVILGATLADELGLPLDEGTNPERCILVVRGGATPNQQPARPEAQAAS